jgi:hypothetical protein
VLVQPGTDIPDHLLTEPSGNVGMRVLGNGVQEQQRKQQDHNVNHACVVTKSHVIIYGILNEERTDRRENAKNHRKEYQTVESAAVRSEKFHQPFKDCPVNYISTLYLFSLHREPI